MTLLETFRTSVFGKVLFIGVLIFSLLIPLRMIRGLIVERAQRHETARAEIAGTWGGAQTLGGPILVVPFRFTTMSFAQAITVSDELYLLPEELEIESDAQVEKLKRGIYEVPVYAALVRMSGRFAIPDLSADYDDLEMLWDQAQIALPISDARSIKEPVQLTSGGASAVFQPGGTRVAGFAPQLVARYAELGRGAPSAPLAFSLDVKFGGSSSLEFLPLGGVTRATMKSNWPSPSFGGAYLPEQRAVTADGFNASWRVLDLGRTFGSSWKRSDGVPASVEATSFGASLITPIGVHAASLRSVKYGVLLIGLTFVAYFLFELFAAAAAACAALPADRIGELRVLSLVARARRARRLRARVCRERGRVDDADKRLQRRGAALDAPRAADRSAARHDVRIPVRDAARRGLRAAVRRGRHVRGARDLHARDPARRLAPSDLRPRAPDDRDSAEPRVQLHA